jgi:hypothetical protein
MLLLSLTISPIQTTLQATAPTGIVLTSVTNRREWIPQQLLGMYQKIGVSSAHMLDTRTNVISRGLLHVWVHWDLLDNSGGRVYDFQAAYTLANIDGSLRITAIAHNEMVKSRAYLMNARQ